jgi:hypothetical protein
VNDAHSALLHFYWRPERLQPVSSTGNFVFNDEERNALGHHKYVSGTEHLVKAELTALLEMLGVYSQSATRVEQIYGPMTGLARIIHAHNALIDFRDRPFSLDEFSQSVRDVLARCV